MAITQAVYPRFKFQIPVQSTSTNGYKVWVYSAGSASNPPSTTDLQTIYADADQSGGAISNPVTLDSNGEADIWFIADAKIVVTDASDNVVNSSTTDNVPANITASAASGSGSAEGFYPVNGGFEDDTAGVPDNWTVAAGSGGTIAVSTAEVNSGTQSLIMTSGGGAAAGTCKSAKFPVSGGQAIELTFDYISTNAATTNTITYEFFTEAGASVSSGTIFTDSGTAPTSWSSELRRLAVPTTATQLEITLNGVSVALAASTYFDNVRVKNVSGLEPAIVDQNDNELVTFVDTASAVNHPEVTNAATTNGPAIRAAGDDTNIDLVLGGKGTGVVRADDITAETTNGDLDLAGDGTGKVNIEEAVLNTSVSGTAVLDEDDMTSNSATKLATQQSIKAYTDTRVASLTTHIEDIGDWNMYVSGTGSNTTAFNHSIPDHTKIRRITVTIRDDADSSYYDFSDNDCEVRISSTTVFLDHNGASEFNTLGFDATSYNRGWVVVELAD